MTPREYDMSQRAAAVEQTRRRIVEATVELHGEKGIFGTSWRDIAERADVSVATVYKHFPSLEELVPACGELLMEEIRPPSPESAPEVVGDGGSSVERLERAALELFSFYERGGRHLESDFRERELPAMLEWEAYLRETVDSFVREALQGTHVEHGELEAACALLDHSAFLAFQRRGIETPRAARIVAELIACRTSRRKDT